MGSSAFAKKQEMKTISHIDVFPSLSLKVLSEHTRLQCYHWYILPYMKPTLLLWTQGHLIKEVHFLLVILMQHDAMNSVITFTVSQTVFSDKSWYLVTTNLKSLRPYFLPVLRKIDQSLTINDIFKHN